MKLWVDDIRPAPKGYCWVKSVNEAKDRIERQEKLFNSACNQARFHMFHDNYQSVEDYLKESKEVKVELIDLGYDAGDYASDGGDYIKLLDWLEKTGRDYPIRIHSANLVGVQNMRRIIERNGWKEIK